MLRVTAVAQVAGLAGVAPGGVPGAGTRSAAAVGFGALAGVGGMSGLLLYMRGLAVGPMGVVAPLSAVVGAGLPLVAGVLGGERPGAAGWLALVVALVAIALAGAGSRGDAAAGAGLVFGLGAGAGFGLFFVALDLTPDGSGLWPLVAGRVVSVTLLALALLVPAQRGPLHGVALMLLCGVLDTARTCCSCWPRGTGSAEHDGVLVSVCPVVVVLLGADRAEPAAERAAANGGRAGVDGERDLTPRRGERLPQRSWAPRRQPELRVHVVIGTPTRIGHR